MGEPYRPSNGTEGAIFEARLCERGCGRYRQGRCSILSRAFLYDIGDAQYPAEWVYGDDGRPTCAAFEVARPPKPRNRVRPAEGQGSLL